MNGAKTDNGDNIFIRNAGAPTASATGYDTCAMWYDTTNKIVYKNTGTTSVAVWTVMADATALAVETSRLDVVEPQNYTLTLVMADVADGTATATITVEDGVGDAVAAKKLVRFYWSSAAGGAEVAATTIAATTGTIATVVNAGASVDVVTDATGNAVLVVTDTDGTYFGNIAIGGLLVSTTVVMSDAS